MKTSLVVMVLAIAAGAVGQQTTPQGQPPASGQTPAAAASSAARH